jgi:exosortase/archaeosortase family protein
MERLRNTGTPVARGTQSQQRRTIAPSRAIAYGRLFETRIWAKMVLVVATAPIAILCNAARIVLMGILTQYKPETAEGTYHTLEGWVIFTFGLWACSPSGYWTELERNLIPE